jgi:hypothetical protein
MKAVGASAAFAIPAVLAFWCGEVEAYRPFDGTDAAVAEKGEMEIELGPVEYLREGAERTLLAPDLRINYGFIPRWEAALEGKLLAWTNSPAEIIAAWPRTVIRSRWPRALTRSTQNPFSSLWNVTRSTRPARASVAAFVPAGSTTVAI